MEDIHNAVKAFPGLLQRKRARFKLLRGPQWEYCNRPTKVLSQSYPECCYDET
uniref:Uncharacterized protein n=1 Tax=Utricularia reniformis TaxID=192314 RepID=A0A1Y0B0J1_9LAMI|nr:hypothetical protein AEK19_MT0644 [Utricularia reniformis]ART30897.1 hypothetical protein AEK19_MT0644 [Utricularia reniformis]